jgi:hypothetical protein
MSNPNYLNNSELTKTSIDSAYQFSSFSPYIINGGLNSKFSPICIFCSFQESISLINDGSFRQCKRCKKQFKARLIK